MLPKDPRLTCITSSSKILYLYSADSILVFSILVSKHGSTAYIEKVDSTGFSNSLPPSLISAATASHLLRTFKHLALFSRPSPSYLFPGSESNKHKRVLDQRQLLNWWAKCLSHPQLSGCAKYCLVPNETKRVFQTVDMSNWQWGWPWKGTEKAADVFFEFPDDPKTRALEMLKNDEATVQDFTATLDAMAEFNTGLAGYLVLKQSDSGASVTSNISPLVDLLDDKLKSAPISNDLFTLVMDTLLKGDFETKDEALKSSLAVKEVIDLHKDQVVEIGLPQIERTKEAKRPAAAPAVVNNLQGLVKRKKVA